jgi:hypothetical protein
MSFFGRLFSRISAGIDKFNDNPLTGRGAYWVLMTALYIHVWDQKILAARLERIEQAQLAMNKDGRLSVWVPRACRPVTEEGMAVV